MLKWLILIVSYSYLAYKLITFDQYDELAAHWKQMPASQLWWLVVTLILLPVNMLLEALKWKLFVSKIQKIDIFTSLKSILSGIYTGFFTPNRVGELVGRVAFIDAEKRKSGVTLSIVNILTQNLATIVCGLPAIVIFWRYKNNLLNTENTHYLEYAVLSMLFLVTLYFALPIISGKLDRTKFSTRISAFTACLSVFRFSDLLLILVVALIRYIVYAMQFYFILLFLGVQLLPWEAAVSIPSSYLLITLTPSFSFSEVAIRGSYAVFFINSFSPDVAGIALAGIGVWFVNYAIPMMAGSVIATKKQV